MMGSEEVNLCFISTLYANRVTDAVWSSFLQASCRWLVAGNGKMSRKIVGRSAPCNHCLSWFLMSFCQSSASTRFPERDFTKWNQGSRAGQKSPPKAYMCEGFYLLINGIACDYTLKMVTRKTDTVIMLYNRLCRLSRTAIYFDFLVLFC